MMTDNPASVADLRERVLQLATQAINTRPLSVNMRPLLREHMQAVDALIAAARREAQVGNRFCSACYTCDRHREAGPAVETTEAIVDEAIATVERQGYPPAAPARRMRGNSGELYDEYHQQEHDENPYCAERPPCTPLEEQ